MAHGGGDDHVRARGETLEAGRDVDRRAEVVEAVVERDGDTGTVVDPCLEQQRPHTLWRRGEPALRHKDRPYRRRWVPEDGHHRVADRLHDRPTLGDNRVAQHVEVVHHEAEGGRVADLMI